MIIMKGNKMEVKVLNNERKDLGNLIKEGFTLIEIMIVIMIAGLLMAGAFVGWQYYQGALVRQNDQKLAALDVALEMYQQRIGEYPRDLSELIEGPQNPALKRKFSEAFVREKDLIDPWNRKFVYELLPKGSKNPYELYSTGKAGDKKIYSPRSAE